MPRGIPAEKPPVGRHTDYKPEYCERVIEMGKKGYAVVEMAAELGYCNKTLCYWANQFEDFCKAFTRAKILSQAHYVRTNRENLTNKDYQFKATEFHMKFFHGMREERLYSIPGWDDSLSVEEKCDMIINQVAIGEMPTEQGEGLVRMVCARAGLKIEEIETKVNTLLEKLGDI